LFGISVQYCNIQLLLQVTALLALSEGAHFLSNGMLYVTEKLRLGPHGATSLVVRVVVTSSGLKNMTGIETMKLSSSSSSALQGLGHYDLSQSCNWYIIY
jgi:hypothetical protein